MRAQKSRLWQGLIVRLVHTLQPLTLLQRDNVTRLKNRVK